MDTLIQSQLVDQHWTFDADWNDAKARTYAQNFGLAWQSPLIEWVQLTRQFYLEYEHSPNTRVLVRYLKTRQQAVSSMQLQIYLQGNPALVLAYLSGIAKPKQCF